MSLPRRHAIVVGLDLSEYADEVLVRAMDQAGRHDRPALHVLTVVPTDHGFWRRPSDAEVAAHEQEAQRTLVERVLRILDDAVPPERRLGWAIRLHVRRGRPADQIVELAEETRADLVVVGRFGHAGGGRLGSVADRVVAAAECPVLVVTPPRTTTASDRQCPDCVQVRADSDGEQWFCPRHHTDRLPGLSVLVGPGIGAGGPSSGGTMW